MPKDSDTAPATLQNSTTHVAAIREWLILAAGRSSARIKDVTEPVALADAEVPVCR